MDLKISNYEVSIPTMTLYNGSTDYQWTNEESMDYYRSVGEDNYDLWAMKFGVPPPFWTDPTPTARGYETTHKTPKTKKKPEKMKIKEQRAKEKSRRVDSVPTELDGCEYYEDWDEMRWRKECLKVLRDGVDLTDYYDAVRNEQIWRKTYGILSHF